MEFVTYEQDGFVGVVTINRPKALNALNSETLDELNTALTEIEARDDIKVVILNRCRRKIICCRCRHL